MLPTPVFLPGKVPWTEEPDRPQSMGSETVPSDYHFHLKLLLNYIDVSPQMKPQL